MVTNDIYSIMDGKIIIMDEQHPCGWKVVVHKWTYPWTTKLSHMNYHMKYPIFGKQFENIYEWFLD
jgi:hypothetical protein